MILLYLTLVTFCPSHKGATMVVDFWLLAMVTRLRLNTQQLYVLGLAVVHYTLLGEVYLLFLL